MALPGVQINVSDGALGRTTVTDDGVAAMVLTGIAASGLALNVPARIYSLSDAATLGIAVATHPYAYGQISDFYSKTGVGAELWIILVAEATTHAAVFTATTGPMQKLLDAAQGRVTIAATALGRAVGYTPTMTGLLDYDLVAVATLAQAVANGQTAKFSPLRVVLDGSYLVTPLTGVVSVKGANDRVGVFLGVTESGKRTASMGMFLGALAAIPVHQSIARVKTGMFSANGALTSGLPLSGYSDAQLGSLHDAGYMILRSFQGLQGAFISKDLTLASDTSDYTSIALGRTMDKAIRLAYQTYVLELNDTVEISSDGKLLPTKVSYIEDVIRRTLNQRMVAEGNCSAVNVSVDPNQNVLSTEMIKVVVKITPLGYLGSIVVELGFFNPSN
ncbi:DUF2586 family protein [Dyadobacter frigoris]|uniref:DUF2586 family protein n=1 Tax=Dyadobacter frigoris TaxID=2576211 RepID=A0A4U6D049_9BACT|nr:DUF2586 family protein [Dyadobacter frigoris]TKT89477.1 hypothetical protein FDK13_24350 [Dyadobacter frigoris]